MIEEQAIDHTVLARKGRSLVAREERATVGEMRVENARMSCRNVDVYYNFGEKKGH